jgi:hypothetical protein
MTYEKAIQHTCPIHEDPTQKMPVCRNMKSFKDSDENETFYCMVMRCPVTDRFFPTEFVEGFQNE